MSNTYNITTINNDTYSGTEFQVFVNSTELNLTGYSLKMQVKKRIGDTAIFTLTSTSGLTITDSTAGKLRIDEQIFSGTPDNYIYDIQFTNSTGRIKTYISGNFIITGDVTQ
jgi:hypothetical protein